jgi:hypothetical protein
MDWHRELLSAKQKQILSFLLFLVILGSVFAAFYVLADQHRPWWQRTLFFGLLFGGLTAVNFVRSALSHIKSRRTQPKI